MSGDTKSILIVDDEPDIALALTMTLEDAGYVVETLDRGDRLMQRLQAGNPPCLILLDMLLAGEDGRVLTRRLKADPATRDIPILMLSAHPLSAQEAIDAGADGFLPKPFELDVLLATVATYLV